MVVGTGTGRAGQGRAGTHGRARRTRWTAALGATVLGITAAPVAAHADDGERRAGFRTAQASFLTTGDRADVTFTPIITTGETLAGGYRFESIPDG
ncbi:MAG: hypothetical protein HY830_11395, partial [Actinobacteria bacterium]|nr:hypothetical protein [Actinomycetota bacterium]